MLQTFLQSYNFLIKFKYVEECTVLKKLGTFFRKFEKKHLIFSRHNFFCAETLY